MTESFQELISCTPNGLYCPAGDFYIDPWLPVDKAVITHAHSDHARSGSKAYLATPESEPLLRLRLGRNIQLQPLTYGSPIRIGKASVSLHPAGHTYSVQPKFVSKSKVKSSLLLGTINFNPTRPALLGNRFLATA